MPGKPYIKTGNSTWTKVKRIYIKSGGQTWAPIRKAYIKVRESGSVSGRWAKFYDTTSNRPFIEGNDRPKIRLNTFRTNSTYNPTGTENDPVNPVVEAPPVQQMGPPTTTPTSGWPSGTIGNHLWGYDGDWRSGNGSAITYTYQWLYNLTGDRNDNTFDPAFSPEYSSTTNASNTSSTGRADMLTNSSTYLGRNGGDYFDKNFLTFRVVATNSAGSVAEESDTQLYIVRQKPTGTVNMINTSVDVPETLSANITYSNEWYRKTDVYDSKVEWFAIDAIGDPLTISNRVAIQDLDEVVVTGTTTKSGTVFHNATIPNKIYAIRLTLNNSNTQAAVIPISGFIPNLPFTTEDYSTPGSPLTVTTLNILDYYNQKGTDNRGYIPVAGLFKIQSNVTGVDGSTTYRIRYRMYNWQNGSYYGMDGTNYGTAASSAWTTRTGSNSSFGFGGTLINNITVSGTTATLTHNESISSSSFGSTTYDVGQDRWQIEIEVSALKNSVRKYYADVVGGIPYYVSRAATSTLSASPSNAQVNQNVTLSGSFGGLGGGSSYPRQYRIYYGDGTDSGYLPIGEYSYGTANPSFSVIKQYSSNGEYFPYIITMPDYQTTSTSLVVAAALTAPTITSVSAGNVGGPVTVNYEGGSGAARQFYWYSSNVAPNYEVTPDASGTSTTSLTDNTGPTGTGTYYAYVRSVSTAGTIAVGPSAVASAWSAGYPFTMIPPSYNVSWNGNGGSSGNEGIPWSFTAGGSVTVPSATRIGYDFVRWTDTPSGDYTYTTTNVGGTWSPPAQNITMYARWQIRVCTIPNVIGMSEYDASLALNNAGFFYEYTDYVNTSDASLNGKVQGVDPGVGTQPGCGSNVALYIYNYVAETITYGACTPYGSPYYSTSGYECYGTYSYAYTDNYYSQRRQILSNGTWNGSYDYSCGNTSVRTYGSFSQVNGQCGYSPPAVTPAITSGPFISWGSGNNFTLSASASDATNLEFQVQFANSSGGTVQNTQTFFFGASSGGGTTGSQSYSWARTRVRANNSSTGLSSAFTGYSGWA